MENSIITYNILNFKNKIAAFDLDHTLIQPKNNKIFPKDKDDWEWKCNILDVLTLLDKNDWSIVIFTNQLGVKRGTITKDDLLFKFKNIHISSKLNITFIASINNNYFRKPFPGMWEYIFKKKTFHSVFYCGDAFDPNHTKLKASDLKFALNLNIPFIKNTTIFMDGFTINKLDGLYEKLDIQNFITLTSIKRDVVKGEKIKLIQFIKKYKYLFIISPPSSGKTTFCKKYLTSHQFLRLSKDDYSTPVKYLKDINIKSTNKLVFDNTNYTEKSRNKIIEVLISENVSIDQIGYIYRDIKKQDSIYLNNYRCFITKGLEKLLPEVVIHKYYKSLEIPDKNCLKLSSWVDNKNIKDFII